ncbi:Uncharacterised protein [Mycoplasmopsis californica]|uniref:Uncharacterized protein n=1 Tax=Mycoplasmopsis equigenitalium TaxID=114883 RepID=A0ABY5J163_9BACT|nr:hypothetical protein [Mycoplasmopsis equigenitalium]UUD36988.1 hypothetical protein NPA09_00195 [Mycoplasmopsis equigenitalium]VEU69714.1 Uncharacterised protein [Mycoplasmopsis californica]
MKKIWFSLPALLAAASVSFGAQITQQKTQNSINTSASVVGNNKYKVTINNKDYAFSNEDDVLDEILEDLRIKNERLIGQKNYANADHEIVINDHVRKYDINKIQSVYKDNNGRHTASKHAAYLTFTEDKNITKKYYGFHENNIFDTKEEASKDIQRNLSVANNKIFIKIGDKYINPFVINDNIRNDLVGHLLKNEKKSLEALQLKNGNYLLLDETKKEDFIRLLSLKITDRLEKDEIPLFNISLSWLSDDEVNPSKIAYRKDEPSSRSEIKWLNYHSVLDWQNKDDVLSKNISLPWIDSYLKNENNENFGSLVNFDVVEGRKFLYVWYQNATFELKPDISFLDFKQLKVTTNNNFETNFYPTFDWYIPTDIMEIVGHDWSNCRRSALNFNLHLKTEFANQVFLDAINNYLENNDVLTGAGKINDYSGIKNLNLEDFKKITKFENELIIKRNSVFSRTKNRNTRYTEAFHDYKSIVRNCINKLLKNRLVFNKVIHDNETPYFIENNNEGKKSYINISNYGKDKVFHEHYDILETNKKIVDLNELNMLNVTDIIKNYKENTSTLLQYLSFTKNQNPLAYGEMIKNFDNILISPNVYHVSSGFGALDKTYHLPFDESVDFVIYKDFKVKKANMTNDIKPKPFYKLDGLSTILDETYFDTLKKKFDFSHKEIVVLNYNFILNKYLSPDEDYVLYTENGKKDVISSKIFNVVSVVWDGKEKYFDNYNLIAEFVKKYISSHKIELN